jgi:Methyltransferase FkbM domain
LSLNVSLQESGLSLIGVASDADLVSIVQDLATSKRLDFIKIDIEGEERDVFNEPESREVLCNAICIFVELHERYAVGAEDALRAFVESGCPADKRMVRIPTHSEYELVCRQRM